MTGRHVRWGVIGCGGIARRRTIPEGILPASNAKLVAVLDRTAATTAAVASQFGVTPAASIDNLLRPDIDAIYVASPVNLHHEHVLRCVAAGKHVLCEKPLALSTGEAGEMVAAARSHGVQFGTAFMMRFHPQHQAALGLIRAGRLGRPVYARAQLSCWYPPLERAWRQDPVLGGGGSLVDLGSHLLDLLEMFFGPIAKVSCFINNLVHHYRSEDGAIAMLWFQSGALGAIDAFFSIRDESAKNVLELYGSHGSILASGTIGQESAGTMSAYFEHGEAADGPREARVAAERFPIAPAPVNVYRAEIEEFSQALLEAQPSELAGDAGLRNQRLLAACYESARTGQAVPAAGPGSGGAGDVKSMGPP